MHVSLTEMKPVPGEEGGVVLEVDAATNNVALVKLGAIMLPNIVSREAPAIIAVVPP